MYRVHHPETHHDVWAAGGTDKPLQHRQPREMEALLNVLGGVVVYLRTKLIRNAWRLMNVSDFDLQRIIREMFRFV